MKRVGIITLAVLGLIVLSGAAHAEIFKWVDANGKVHYSDRKISTKAEQLNVKTGAKTLGEDTKEVKQRLVQQQKYVNFLQSERLERQEKRKEAQQEKDKERKLCAAMYDQLKSYSQGNHRWYELDEVSGERSYLSDDQVEAKKQKLQADIESNC